MWEEITPPTPGGAFLFERVFATDKEGSVNKTTIRNFVAWLDKASMDDIRLGLRLIDEEIIARLEVLSLPSASRK